MARRLIRLGGGKPKTVWRRICEDHKSWWALSHDNVVERGLRNAYFAERGLVTLRDRYEAAWATIPAPRQLTLFAGQLRS